MEDKNKNKSIFTDSNVSLFDSYTVNDFIDIEIYKHNLKNEFYYHPVEPDLTYDITENYEDYVINDVEFFDDRIIDYSIFIPETKMKIESKLQNDTLLTGDIKEDTRIIEEISREFLNKKGKVGIYLYNSIYGFPFTVMNKIHSVLDKRDSGVLDKKWYNKIVKLVSNLSTNKIMIPDKMIDNIVYYVVRDLLLNGKLQVFFEDEFIEDIHINSSDREIYISHSEYGNIKSTVKFNEDELESYAKNVAQQSGKTISKSKPVLDGSLRDGSRVRLNYANEVNTEGSNMTIRFFDDEPLTPIDLIQFNTFTVSQMAYIWMGLEYSKSILIAGGTASGKTTTMNASSLFIPNDFKIVSIEDTREVELPHENWVKHVTRDSVINEESEIGMFELLKGALRERPDYILVGEVRGEEARTLFQAMNTGHASISTVHADNPKSAIDRLEQDNIGVPRGLMSALDLIVVQRRLSDGDDKIRRAMELTEIDRINVDNDIEMQTVYTYNSKIDSMNKKYKLDESPLLNDIKNINGWERENLEKEVKDKEKVLQYLVDNDITNYKDVYIIVQLYMRNKELILQAIESDELMKYIQDNGIIETSDESEDVESVSIDIISKTEKDNELEDNELEDDENDISKFDNLKNHSIEFKNSITTQLSTYNKKIKDKLSKIGDNNE